MSSFDPKPTDEQSEKASPTQDFFEKRSYDAEVASLADSSDGDEALKLVGRERTAEFSEEYNRKLRNKLVLHLPHCDL